MKGSEKGKGNTVKRKGWKGRQRKRTGGKRRGQERREEKRREEKGKGERKEMRRYKIITVVSFGVSFLPLTNNKTFKLRHGSHLGKIGIIFEFFCQHKHF